MAEQPNYNSGKKPRMNYYSEDPHKAARKRTRKEGQPSPFQVVKTFLLSLPGRPTVQRNTYALIQGLGYEKSVIIPDLNKYNPNVDLKMMHDEMGIEHVILRMGGPTQFVLDNLNPVEDPTWRKYFTLAKSLNFKSIGGYFIYSAAFDYTDYVLGHYLFDTIHDWTSGGFIPDYFIGDDEVNTWIEHGTTVYATPVNQVKGIQNLYPKLWDKYKKPSAEYTARWFISQTIPSGGNYLEAYMTWLDQVNKGYATQGAMGKQLLNWWAWYINEFNGKPTVYNHESDVLNALPLPTSDQVNKYLTVGSNSMYDLHQYTSTMLTPYNKNAAGQVSGLDWSVTRLPESEFLATINITDSGGGDNGGGDNGGGDTGDLQKTVDALVTWAKGVSVPAVPPFAG